MDWNNLINRSEIVPKTPNLDALNFRRVDDAEVIVEDIVKAVNDFNQKLDDDHEVGIMLASFGQTITVNISTIGYEGSKLIRFIGNISDSGAPVELFQHVSQMNFLLISLPRENKEEPKKQIGFFQE
jgi:hypothetical protein